MGGSVGAAIKKTTKKVTGSAEGALKALSWVYNPYGNLAKTGAKKAGANDIAEISTPYSKPTSALGKKMIDDPKQARIDGDKFEQQQIEANAAQLKKIEGRKAQSDAESEAGKDLERKRKKQKRRRSSQGRQGTILTENLGGAGGEDSTRKTLLGK